MNNSLIIKIKYLMSLKGINSSKDIATALHMSIATFYNRCRDPDNFTVEELNRISKITNTPTWEILKPDGVAK